MTLSETAALMAATGFSPEQINAFLIAADNSRREKAREGNRLRQAKLRASRNADNAVTNSDEPLSDVTTSDEPLPRAPIRERVPYLAKKEDISSLRSDNTPSPKATAKKSSPEAVLRILGEVLSPEVAVAVVEHRRAKRSPVSEFVARRLVKRFAEEKNPDEAAGMMIERGWLTYNPDWLKPKQQPRGSPHHASGQSNGNIFKWAMSSDDEPDASHPEEGFEGVTIDADFRRVP